MKKALCLLLACLLAATAGFAAGEGIVADELPRELYETVREGAGTAEKFDYPSKDYAGDGTEVTKHAVIYLPPGYDGTGEYDVLVLCHGIGGNENEWGFLNNYSVAKNVVDNLIVQGVIRPLIIVMPNGRSTANYMDSSMDNAASFYVFGQELRNDLIPYVDSHYATWAAAHPGDPAAREHRAMAGLSMGGMQTINIGLCECLDLFSAFGAFSAAPTSYEGRKIASKLEQFPDATIRFFYSICGTEDGVAYGAASAAAKNLPDYTARVDSSNWLWHEKPGGHDFQIWNLGLYNFLRILNADRAE